MYWERTLQKWYSAFLSVSCQGYVILIFLFFKFHLFIFRQWGRDRNTDALVASCPPLNRNLACNPGCALTRNQTGRLWVCGMTPNPWSHAGQDSGVAQLTMRSCGQLRLFQPDGQRTRGGRNQSPRNSDSLHLFFLSFALSFSRMSQLPLKSRLACFFHRLEKCFF